ncbi:hypothetical protein GCM10023194_17240 [Planotetraspora phitsanulokensis]|uniref:Uncharacterized protein n=1 Tax=Planotetraspora phitsanulokensis TaxID=575192 RepID=A0A8J3U9M9_9ACTN|nr:hypothetical protein [Planotetraspora phitsanulokensis]GII35085.1 hypothetical protein Pph01_00880 [Planotetraspora phitsanulokensis]
MQADIATQLITASATLGGVVLTLLANAFLERRRAHDGHELETHRVTSEHAKWLREERHRAYSGMSIAGEEVQQWMRNDLLEIAASGDEKAREQAAAQWRLLRTELRKAYNQVAIFGADEARAEALTLWRAARDTGNDYLFPSIDHPAPEEPVRTIREGVARLGVAGDAFLTACRKDLQGGAVG